MTEPTLVHHSTDDMDRLYRAFRDSEINGSLEITQGSGYVKARLYCFGSPGDVMDEMKRLTRDDTPDGK